MHLANYLGMLHRIAQAAKGARDEELAATVQACAGDTAPQLRWLRTRMKTAAPQALVVA